ncbi:MAG: hypothetical protein IJD67_03785 [Clostridia bacterium]|nr:hypothetical protein [Clostridia bacterium]
MANKILRLYTHLSIGIIAAGAVLRVVIALFFTEENLGVYVRGSVFPLIADLLLAISIIILTTLPCIYKKHFSRREINGETKLTVFATATLGFMFLAFSLLLLLSMVSVKHFDTTGILLTVTSIFAAVYYLAKIFARGCREESGAILSMIPIVWALVALIDVYFDMSVLITSPNRAIHQLALLAFSIFVLAETRMVLKLENTLLYAPAAAISALLLASASLSNLLCPHIMMLGETDRPIIYAVELAAAFYSATKLYQFCLYGKEKEPSNNS